MKEGSSQSQLNRKYLPQHLEDYLYNPRANRNIFPPYSRTRKKLERSIQTIHLTKARTMDSPDEIGGNHLSNLPFGRTPDYTWRLKLRRSPMPVRSLFGPAATKQACHCERPKEAWQSHKVRLLRLCLAATLCVTFYFSLFISSVEAGTAFVAEGQTQWTNQRKVITNNYGYWVFFSTSAPAEYPPWSSGAQGPYASYPESTLDPTGGRFMCSFSPDGANWGEPQPVFSDEESYRNGSVWYVSSSSEVIAIAGSRIWSGYAFLRKATLNHPGNPSWGLRRTTTNLNDDGWRDTSTANEDILTGGFPYVMQADGPTYKNIWIGSSGGQLDIDDRTWHSAYVLNDFTGGLSKNAAAGQMGTERDGTTTYDKGIILPAGNDDTVKVYCTNADANAASVDDLRFCYGLGNSDITPTTVVPADTDKASLRTTDNAPSGVSDSNYNHHIVYIDQSGNVIYKRFYGASSYDTNVDIDGGTAANNQAVVGIAKYSEGYEKLIVVYVNSAGDLYKVESDTFTTSAPTWKSPSQWKIGGTYACRWPNIQYETQSPNPICVAWSTEEGNVYFDWIPVSTAPAPSISLINPTQAPFNAKQFDITVNGSGFDNWGTGMTANFVLASDTNTVAQATEIKVSSVTYVGTSQIKITAIIGNIPTGEGNYKIVVNNPDARSSSPSSDTFIVLAPVIDTISPTSGGQNALRTITINGSNFQIWGSTKPTADFGTKVTLSSTTYISSSQIKVTIQVLPDADSGPRSITVTNCDGQLSNILVDSFTVTAPQVSVSTPAANGDIDIQSQLLDISGTAWIIPSAPATCLGSELRIKRQSDGYCWNGVSFDEEVGGEFWNDANGNNWTYPSTTWDDQQDGETYIIQARGRSSDGGHSYNKVERTVKLDANNPTLAISDPSDTKKNKQTSIKGQATDSASGISGADKVQIWIKDLTLGSTYWNGSVWLSTTTQQWLQVSSYVDPNWTYTISYPTACWTDCHQYEIYAQAWDRVNHLGTVVLSQKFWYDVTAPIATLTVPENGKWYTSMNEINGTVTDNTLDIDPKGKVYLKVVNQTNSKYLTQGSTWTSSATPIWIETNFRGTGKSREWYFNTSQVVWDNMIQYEVAVYAEDGAVGQPTGPNEQAQPWPQATFTYDDSVPESSITSLVPNRIYSNGPSLAGTALDEYDNLENVKVCLKQYVGGAKYWKGGPSFEVGYDTNCWQVATGTTSWEYTGFSDWEDGQRYRLWSKAYDTARNIENVPDSNITGDIGGKYFGYDETSPISSITSPQNGDCFNQTTAPGSITGEATDPTNGSGVDQVLVNIRYLPTGTTTYLAWKGAQWGTPGDYEINCDAFPWSISMPGAWGPSMDGQIIEVRTWSYDKAYPYNSEALSTKCSFKYDITRPTSAITSPSTSDPLYPYYANISSFTGTALDSSSGSASGVKEVGVRIKRSSDNYYWNGSNWIATSTFDVGSGSTTWSYTNVPSLGNGITYTVNCRAQDKAGNFEANLTTFSFTCDKAPPTSNNGAYNGTYDRIDGTASDGGVGVNNVVLRIKRNEDSLYWNVDQSTWTVFSSTACWMQATTSDNWAHWAVDTSSVTWEDDHYYTHTSKAVDKLANEEATPPGKGQQFCYTLPATHFAISMSTTVVAGVAEPVTISALNELQGVAKSYLGILEFSCPDDPSTILPQDYQFTSQDEGVHHFDVATGTGVTLFKAGNIVAKVEDSADANIKAEKTILVKNASANYITVTFPASVTAGTLYDITVKVYDEFGNQVKDPAYAGTVTFYSEAEARASLPADYAFVPQDQGSHSWLVSQSTGVILRTATQTGWKVKVTDTVNTSITGEKTGIIVNVGTPATYEVKVNTTPVIAAGEGRSVYVRATDSYGNTVKNYDKTIRFDDDDPLTSQGDGLPSDYTFQVSEQGEHNFEGTTSTNTVRLKTKGTRWVKVYEIETPSREGYHQNIQVNAGAVTKFKVEMSTYCTAGVPEDITIRARDQYDNNSDSYNTTLTFECSVAPDWNSPAPASMTNGYCYKDDYVAIYKGGTGIWVRAKDASYQGQQDNIEVVAKSPHHLKVFNYPSSVQAGSTGNYVWVEAQDEYNNKYKFYTGTVTFSSSDLQAQLPADYVFQLSDNGSRPFQVILKTVGTNWNIKAWDKYDTNITTGTQSGISVTPKAADHFVVNLSINQTVGVRSTIIVVEAKDQYGNRDTNYSADNSKIITFYSDDTGATFQPPTYNFLSTDNGYKEFKDSDGYGVTFSTGGTFYVRAEDNQTTPISGQKDNIFVTVRPDSTISFPQSDGKYNSVSPPTIWGTYWDDYQVTTVEISIQKNLAPDWHWNESLNDWQERGAGNPYWNTATVWSSSWTYTGISNSKFASGNSYTIKSRAKDNLNNYEATPYPSISFLYDTDEPATTITLPQDGVDRNTSFGVNGTAYDEIIGYDSGLATLKIQVKGLTSSTTEYWDPPGWTGSEVWLGATAGEDWVLASTPTWKNGYKYEVRAYHKDWAGNTESPPALNSFIFDTDRPDSSISRPVNPFHGQDLTMVWGTFVDYPYLPSYSSGVSSMTVRIYCWSGSYQGKYWDGSSWQSLSPENAWQYGSVWVSSWTYTSLSSAWNDGASYIVNSRAIDSATNVELTISTATFTFDNMPPVSVITKPAKDANLNSLDRIEGTASDATSSVSKVEILIKNITDNTYWDGVSNWISTATWFTANGKESWYYDMSNWIPDKEYQIQSRATDNVETGNVESPSSGNYFKFDTVAPSSSISSPGHNAVLKGLSTISGTSTDPGNQPSQVDRVMVTIQNPQNRYWKQGSIWEIDFTSHTAIGTLSWTLNISTQALTDQATYLIKTKSIDKARNEENWGNPGDSNAHNFIYDVTAPQSAIAIPGHLDHLSQLPTISGIASDAFGLSEVRVSILKTLGNKYWNGSGWFDGEVWNLTYSTSNYTIWTSTGVGWDTNCDYIIKSEAWDKAQPGGNEESSGSEGSANVHRFTFDNTPPVSVITYPTGGTLNTLTQVSGTASDAKSDVAMVKIRIADITTSTTYYWNLESWDTSPLNWHNVEGTSQWTFGSPNITDNTWQSGHRYLIQTRAQDSASPANVETPSSGVIFNFDNTPPQSQVTAPAPAPNNHYSSLGALEGTAQDLHNAISGLKISIFDQDTSKYFVEGNGFIGTDVSTLTATAKDGAFDTLIESWTYTNPALIDAISGWQNGHTYLIKSWAGDIVNNTETPGVGSPMVFDKTKPLSTISVPANDGQYDDTLIQFTGGATDSSPGVLASTKLSLTVDDGSNYRWNGSTWVVSGSDIWINANAVDGSFDEDSEEWLYNFDATKWLSGKSYILKSKSFDRAGNGQETPSESRFMVTLPCHHFDVYAIPSEVTAGVLNGVTIEAKAQDNSRARGYVGTIKFFSDSEATFKIGGVVCDTYTFVGAEEGKHEFNPPNEGVILKTAGSKKVWVNDTGPSPVETGEQTNITVRPNVPKKFQVLVPLEIPKPGTEMGKSGPVMPKTAGGSFDITINCVDDYWNVTNSSPTVKVTTNDSNGIVNPSIVNLSTGTATANVTFKTANSTWTITASDNEYGNEYIDDTSSAITVQPAGAQKLQVLLPVESPKPGTGPGGSGKTGPEQYVVAGATFTITVNACDIYWNVNSGYNPVVTITTTDNYDVEPTTKTLTNGTTTFLITLVTASTHTITARANNFDDGISSTFTVGPSTYTCLEVLLPGETPNPGNLASRGRSGTPDFDSTTPGIQNAVAGTSFNITMRRVDNYWNFVTGEVADVSITSNDPYALSLGTATLIGGTTTWSVALKKANSGRTISVNKSGYSSDTSTSFTVDPSTHTCLQILLPGETNDGGNESNRGRISPPSIELTAGTTFYITVKTTDKYWNPTKPSFDILVNVTSNDPTKPNLGTVAVGQTTGEGMLNVVLYRGVQNGRTITVSRADYQPDTSTTFTVKPAETAKLLVLVPNEDVSPGTSTGRSGTVEDWTAGSYYPVTVKAVDSSWNPTGETIVVDKIYTNDNYSYPITNPITNVTLTDGTSTFMMVLVSRGTRNIIAEDAEYMDNTSSDITVNPDNPIKLQVLVPGEVGIEGHPNGKLDVLPSTRTAGVAFPVTVNSVDQNWNISSSTRTIKLTTNDSNAPPISNQQLVNGTTVFMVTLITANSPWIKAEDTALTDKLLENQSPNIPVVPNPNQYKLLVLLEGESPAPGTSTGKTGPVTNPRAGAPYAVTVRACDNCWNLNTSGTPKVTVTTGDPYAILPSPTNLIGGTTTFMITFKLANTTWTITASDTDGQPPLWTAYVTQPVTVDPGSPVKLQVLAYPESPVPGSDPNGRGKIGTPDWHVAGSSFTVTVNAVDNYWNIVSTNSSVSVVTTDPYDNEPISKQLDKGTNTFKIEMVTKGSWVITAQASGYQAGSSTVTIDAGSATKLQVLLPGETAKEGKWNQLPYGKEGNPLYWVAGSTFNVTINAVDDYWNRVNTTPYVTVTTTDPNDNESTYSGNLNSQGILIPLLRLVTAGFNTVKAEAFSLTSSTSSTTINPGEAAYFKVEVSPRSGIAGNTRDITITAYDGWGSWNAITRTGEGNIANGGTEPGNSYQGTVDFSCNDPYPAGLPSEVTFRTLDAGTTTLYDQVILYTVGSWWVEATDVSYSSIYGRQQNISVSPAETYRFVVSPKTSQEVPAGSYQGITAYLSDFYGNQTPEAGKPCDLTITDVVGSPGYLTITSTTTNTNGEIGPINYYVSTKAGDKATVTVTTGTVTGKSALIRTIGGNPNYLVFIDTPPATLVAGNVTSQPFAVQRYDQYGNITNLTKTTVYLKSNSTGANKGFRYPQGTILSSSVPGVDGEINIYGGQNTAYFYYYDEKASWDEITLSTFTITVSLDTNFGNSDDDTTPLRVDPDVVVNKLAFSSTPWTFTAGTPSGLINIETQDVFSNPKKVNGDTKINLYSLSVGTNSFSAQLDPWTPISYVTISTNTYQQSFYYKDTKSGAQTLKVDEDDSYGYGWLPGFQNQIVLPDRITKLVFTTPAYGPSQPLVAGATSWIMIVEMQDQFGNPSRFLTVGNPLSSNTKLLLSSQPSGQYEFSVSSTTWSPTSEAWIVVGSTSTGFYYKNFKAGTWATTVDSADYAWTDAVQQENVVGAVVGKIVFISPEPKFIAGTCSSTMTIQTQDLYGNVTPVSSSTVISLVSTSPKGVDFSWDGNTWGRTTVTIDAGQSNANFFYTDEIAGNTNVVTAMAPPAKGWIAGTSPVTVTPSHATAFRVFHDGAASVNVLETISVQAIDEFANDATGPPNDNPPYDAPEFQATYYTGTATFTVTGHAKIEEPASATYTFSKADHGFTTFKISDDYVEKVQLTARDGSNPTITGTSIDLSVCGIKVTPISLAPTNIFQGEGILENKQSVGMLRMDIQTNPQAPPQADEAFWTDLKIYRIGDARDADVRQVVLWKDGSTGTIGEFDAPLPPDNFSLGNPSPYDIPLAVGTFIGETGTLTLSLDARMQTLDKSLQRYFLAVNVSTTAVPGRRFAIEIQKPGDFTLAFPEVQIGKDNFAIQTTSSTIQTAPAQVDVTPYNMVYSTQTFQQGTKNLAMVRVVLATDRFTANWTKIKINRKGTGGFDSDVEEVKIYKDREPFGTFEPAVDRVISSGMNKFEAGQVLVNIDSDNVTVGDQPEEITTTPQNYFIVFSIHDTATVGSTIGAECGVGSFWVESPATVNEEPFESGKPTITATEDNLIVAGGAPGGSANVAPAELIQGTTNQAMLHFRLNSDAHTVLWDKLWVELTGAGTYSDVDKVKVFKYNSSAVDEYGRPVIDFDGPDNNPLTMADNDIQLGWAIFTSTTTLIQMSNPITGKTYEEITTTPQSYLVTLDVDVLAKPQDDALGLTVSTSTCFIVLGVDRVGPTGFPRYSSKSRVVEYADTITVVPKSIAAATAMQGSGDPDPTNPADPPAPILQLDLSCDQSDSIWTDIRIDRTGTAEDSEVTSVTVWKDNPLVGDIGNFDTVNDILISNPTKVFLGKTANISLTTQQRIATASQRYFIAYGISDTAIPGNSLGAKIVENSYITVKNPNEHVQFTVLPATSTLLQIYPKPRTLTVNGVDYAGVSTTLSNVLNSTDTVIPVNSTLSFLPSGYIKIDDEIIKYTGKTDTTFEGVTRGASGSQATSHLAEATVEKYFFQNDKDIWMASLEMISNSPYPVGVGWNGLRLILTGTGLFTDIAQVKVWRDNNNNQILDGMDILVATTTFSGTDVSIQFPTTQYVYDYYQYYFLTFSLSGSATPDGLVGMKIDGPNDIYQISPHIVEGGFPILSSQMKVHPTRDELAVSFTDISGAAVPLIQGNKNVGMLKLILSSDENTVIWDRLRVRRAGTGTDSDVGTIKIYRDEAPYEGTFDSSHDSLITTGVNTFIDTFADISFLKPEVITTTPRSYFVVLDIYQLAQVGKSIGVAISSSTYFTVEGVDVVRPASFASANLIVNEYADTITVTPLEPTQTPSQVVQAAQNVPMHKFTLKTNQSDARWTGVKVRRTGTPLSRDADVERVKIYRDLDNNGLFSSASDVEISISTITYTFTDQAVNIYFGTPQVIATAPQTYFLVYDIAVDATLNEQVGAMFDGPGCFFFPVPPNNVDNPVSGDLGPGYWDVTTPIGKFPFESPKVAVKTLELSVVAQDMAPGGARQKEKDVIMEKLALSVNANRAEWDILTVEEIDTAIDSDFALVKLYRDSNGDGVFTSGTDLLIGTGTFSGGIANVIIDSDPAPGIQPELIRTTTSYYFVALDVSDTAIPGDKILLQLTTEDFIDVKPTTIERNYAIPIKTSVTGVRDYRTPTTPRVYAKEWTNDASKISANWESESPIGVIESYYAVGTGPGRADRTNNQWVFAGDRREATVSGLSLQQYRSQDSGPIYYFSVIARTISGEVTLFSDPGYRQFKVDITPPTTVGPPVPEISAEAGATSYNVHWDFAKDPESGVVAYELQERADTSPLWNTISNAILGDSQNYSITGKEAGHFYFYRVRARNGAGSWAEWSEASAPAVTGLPKDIITDVSNYPNPASGDHTTIAYTLKYHAKVTVTIYDLLGHLVLEKEFKPGSEQGHQGPNYWPWDLTNETGDKVAKGGYICRITVDVEDSRAPKYEDRTVQVIRKIGVLR